MAGSRIERGPWKLSCVPLEVGGGWRGRRKVFDGGCGVLLLSLMA